MPEPIVDVIVAVHNPERQISRTIGSILDHTSAPIRLNVVCHNVDPAAVRAKLTDRLDDERLRFLELNDGIHSPSGPFNAGMDAATALFTSIVGSDDELQPGAIDSWLRKAEHDQADMVITRLERSDGLVVAAPPTRWGRTSHLDPVKDRLSYRSAPLGLVRRDRLGWIRLAPGLRNGGDLSYVTQLWFSGARISFDMHGPGYLIHLDADDSVSRTPKTVAQDFLWLDAMLETSWSAELGTRARTSAGVKFIRRHLFGAVDNRSKPETRRDEDGRELAGVARRLSEFAPKATRYLSMAESALFDAIVTGDTPMDALVELAKARRIFPRPRTLFPRNPLLFASTEAPFPLALGSLLVLRSKRTTVATPR